MDSHPVPAEYAGKHTLVMIPTLKKTNETGELIDYDFNPFQDAGEKPLALNARAAKKIKEDFDTSLGENNGQLTPPKNSIGESF